MRGYRFGEGLNERGRSPRAEGHYEDKVSSCKTVPSSFTKKSKWSVVTVSGGVILMTFP